MIEKELVKFLVEHLGYHVVINYLKEALDEIGVELTTKVVIK